MPNSRQTLRAKDIIPIAVVDEEFGGKEEPRGVLRSSSPSRLTRTKACTASLA